MKELLLIDANSLIHRAFHALPPFTAKSGEPTGALYGVASILLKVQREQKPDFWAAAFDRPEPNFREKIFKEYKGQRPAAPEALITQIIKTHELFEKFGIKSFEQPGFEADDIIASLVKKFKKEKDLKIIILTGDLDTLQLVVDDKIVVQTPKRGVNEIIIYNEKAVQERFGLNPEQLPDYKALAGDASDNIPGVFGIGPKTASTILGQFYNLENLYQKLENQKISEFPKKQQKILQKLLTKKEQAFFSKKLVVLQSDLEIKINLEDLIYQEKKETLIEYFQQLGFWSLISRISAAKPAAALF